MLDQAPGNNFIFQFLFTIYDMINNAHTTFIVSQIVILLMMNSDVIYDVMQTRWDGKKRVTF